MKSKLYAQIARALASASDPHVEDTKASIAIKASST